MGLWNFVTASEIRVVEDAREELAALLREVTPGLGARSEQLEAPRGLRARDPRWRCVTAARQVRRQRLADRRQLRPCEQRRSGRRAVVFVARSRGLGALTGKQPRITEAFKIEPVGKVEGLKAVEFRGQVPIDPRTQDFFKVGDRGAQSPAARTDLEKSERDRLKRSLKTFGSATSYGIFAQMDRKESDKQGEVDVLRDRRRAVRMHA